MVISGQWLSITGLVIDIFAALFLIVPSLPDSSLRGQINRFIMPARDIEKAYYNFVNRFAFHSDPRVITPDEVAPSWVTRSQDNPLENELDIIAHLLTQGSWRWNTTTCVDYGILAEGEVDLPEPELYEIWSGPTLELRIKTSDGYQLAKYPLNDWTRKMLHDGKTAALSQIYSILGATTLFIGFSFQIGGYLI